ncbi:hypothetical protein ACFX11_000275 [Malus domestica]
MVLPFLKLGTLAIKTLSKPVAARHKHQAAAPRHEWCRSQRSIRFVPTPNSDPSNSESQPSDHAARKKENKNKKKSEKKKAKAEIRLFSYY